MNMTSEQLRKCAEAMLLVYGWFEEFREKEGRDILTYSFGCKGQCSLFFPGIGDKNTPNCFDVFLGRGKDHVEFKLKFYLNLDTSCFDRIDCVINAGDKKNPPYEPFRMFQGKVSNEFKRQLGSDERRKEISIVSGKNNAVTKTELLSWLEKHFEDLCEALKDVMIGNEKFIEAREDRIKRSLDAGWLMKDKYGSYFVSKEFDFTIREGNEEQEGNGSQEQGEPSSGDVCGRIKDPRNWLVFGAPGTGKSFMINNKACRHKNKSGEYEAGLFECAEGRNPRYERVTFYPTYSYAQFVGTYKPVMKKIEGKAEEEISYEFVPGPFLRVLVNALNKPNEHWCLIIEEINRANAAAVFGDVFQLLDRNSVGDSEYSIAVSEDVKRYLSKNLSTDGKNALKKMTGSEDVLKIPANMYLWATMNSADQGVFPMDTAFKRRWEFEYIDIDAESKKCDKWRVKVGSDEKGYKECNWNDLRKFLNRLLQGNGVNEDKLMGPFFVKAKDDIIDSMQFTSKVLMYLWEDAARMCRAKIFENGIRSYSELVDKWKVNGLKIFEAAKQKANDGQLNGFFDSASPKSGDLNEGSNSSDSVGAGENGSQG